MQKMTLIWIGSLLLGLFAQAAGLGLAEELQPGRQANQEGPRAKQAPKDGTF